MPLTRSFKSLVAARMAREPEFKRALLTEAMNRLLDGDLETGKAMLRDYINAAMGFEALAVATGTPSKSLMRMFSPAGNPTARNLFAVIACLQRDLGVTLEVRAGSIGQFKTWTESVIANAGRERIGPKIWYDTEATAARALVPDASLPPPTASRRPPPVVEENDS